MAADLRTTLDEARRLERPADPGAGRAAVERRLRAHRRRTGTVIAAAVAALLALVVVVTRPGGGEGSLRTAGTPTATTHLIPTDIVAPAMALAYAGEPAPFYGGGATVPGPVAVFTRDDGSGAVAATVLLRRSAPPGSSDGWAVDGQVATGMAGVRNTTRRLDDERRLAVTTSTVTDAELVAAAAALRPGLDGGVDPSAPPAGFRLAARTDLTSLLDPFQAPVARGTGLVILGGSDPPPGSPKTDALIWTGLPADHDLDAVRLTFPDHRDTTVRGHAAVAATMAPLAPTQDGAPVPTIRGRFWLEDDGTFAAVIGLGMDDATLDALVAGLRPVGDEEWARLTRVEKVGPGAPRGTAVAGTAVTGPG